jgi:hypothetical protein
MKKVLFALTAIVLSFSAMAQTSNMRTDIYTYNVI